MEPVLNGNKFVERKPHLFITGQGCYFETKKIAIEEGVGPNANGTWLESITYNGKEWYQAGQINAFD